MRKLVVLAVLLVSLQIGQCNALAYTADATTDNVIRLFTDQITNTPSPVGTAIWFVADTGNNGIDNLGPTFNMANLQAISDGTGNDKLIFSDIIDGQIIGSNPGKYLRQGFAVNDAFSTATIYAFLFNDGTPLTGPETFGTFSFGVVPAPTVGSALYDITGNIFANQNTVLPVPEPSTWTFMAVCGLALGLKRFQKYRGKSVLAASVAV